MILRYLEFPPYCIDTHPAPSVLSPFRKKQILIPFFSLIRVYQESGTGDFNMRISATIWLMGYLIAAASGLTGCSGSSDSPSTSTPTSAQLAATCTALAGKKFNDVTIASTKWFDASGGNPSFCKVTGTRAPYLDIEVDLPDGWSGRLWQQGGAGTDGIIVSAITADATTGAVTDLDIALKTGRSIYAASNGGNRAKVDGEAAPGVWADGTLNGVVSARDYGYEALNTTREFAKALSKSFYGRLPDHTYFSGCSNGGRNAYIAADRWPDEYDGIVSGCMSMDTMGQTASWMSLGDLVGTPAMPSNEQWSAVTKAAITACDALDGITDRIIANQSACKFDASTLQCGQPAANPDTSICLSPLQLQTVKNVMSDLKLANGATIYSGFTWSDWASFISGWGHMGGGFSVLATGDGAWYTTAKQQSFNLERDYPLFLYGLRNVGATIDISRVASFVASGKKLLSWHAGSDNLVSLNDHTKNYSTMTGMAKGMGLINPSVNTRFFVIPGASHGEGFFLTQVNWFDAITNWVETNTPPEQLVFNTTDKVTKTARTLPICQHPQYPRYKGVGNINLAESYTCTTPSP